MSRRSGRHARPPRRAGALRKTVLLAAAVAAVFGLVPVAAQADDPTPSPSSSSAAKSPTESSAAKSSAAKSSANKSSAAQSSSAKPSSAADPSDPAPTTVPATTAPAKSGSTSSSSSAKPSATSSGGPGAAVPNVIPPATGNNAVITVKVGGDRFGVNGVTNLAGVVLGFYAAATGGSPPLHLHVRRGRRLQHHGRRDPARGSQPGPSILGSPDQRPIRLVHQRHAAHGPVDGGRHRGDAVPVPDRSYAPGRQYLHLHRELHGGHRVEQQVGVRRHLAELAQQPGPAQYVRPAGGAGPRPVRVDGPVPCRNSSKPRTRSSTPSSAHRRRCPSSRSRTTHQPTVRP